MADGIDNLAWLFAAGEISTDKNVPQGKLRASRKDLQFIVNSLEVDPIHLTEDVADRVGFAHVLHRHWQDVTIEHSRQHYTRTGVMSQYSKRPEIETPYASGHGNAAILFHNPSMSTPEAGDPRKIHLQGVGYWEFSKQLIKGEKILIDGKFTHDPVSALLLYLDRIEQGIREEIVSLESGKVTPRHSVNYAPYVGLSLVGLGDALLKIAQTDKQRAAEYLELAKRAYKSSGFEDTLYVGRKLMAIGELPPRTHALIPLEELTAEQRQRCVFGAAPPRTAQ